MPSQVLCPACKAEEVKQYQRDYFQEHRDSRRKSESTHKHGGYELLKDPTGDYEPGLRVYADEWEMTKNIGGWPVGCQFRCPDGSIRTVDAVQERMF